MKKMYPVTGRVDTISLIGDVKAEGSSEVPDFWVEAESSQLAEQMALEIVDPLDLTVSHLTIGVPVNMIPAGETTGLTAELENAVDVLDQDNNYDDEHDALRGLTREVAQLLGVKWTNG